MKQEMIKITGAPAQLNANFDEVKAALEKELDKYRIVVTADTVSDAKKLATEMNKTATAIDKRRKDEVAAVSEPIKKFDEQMKELVTMCKDGRQDILDQVKKFEDETRAKAKELLGGYLIDCYTKHGIDIEFQTVVIDDLATLKAVTGTGRLASGAKKEVDARALTAKTLQDRKIMRLKDLEIASHRAGLSAPLTEDHVKPFLFAEDDIYRSELERIIAAETQRQVAAEEAMRAKLKREEEQRKAEQETAAVTTNEPEPVREPEPMVETPSLHESSPVKSSGNGQKVGWVVTCEFEIETGPDATAEAIKANLRQVMKNAGITTLSSVGVVRAGHSEVA
jgi:hypothetical protein